MEQQIHRQLLVLVHLVCLRPKRFRQRVIKLVNDSVFAPKVAGGHLGGGPECGYDVGAAFLDDGSGSGDRDSTLVRTVELTDRFSCLQCVHVPPNAGAHDVPLCNQ